MFGLGRSQARTRAELLRGELGESFDHLRQAAAHAAEGVGASVGPRINTALAPAKPAAGKVRGAAVQVGGAAREYAGPAAEKVRGAAVQVGGAARKVKPGNLKTRKKREREMARKRGFLLAALLAAGAAVGAGGALLARRRRRHQWEEYDLDQRPESPEIGVDGSTVGSLAGAVDPTGEPVTTLADSAAGRVTSAAEAARTHTPSGPPPSTAPAGSTAPTAPTGSTAATGPTGSIGHAGSPSPNSNS